MDEFDQLLTTVESEITKIESTLKKANQSIVQVQEPVKTIATAVPAQVAQLVPEGLMSSLKKVTPGQWIVAGGAAWALASMFAGGEKKDQNKK